MSLAVKFGDSSNASSLSGSIYFNAVTNYTRDYGGEVTKHPIEAGASISDHFISRNSVYKFTGILSHVDFTSIPDLLVLQDNTGDVGEILNKSAYPNQVTVNQADSIVSQILRNSSLGTWLPIDRSSVNVFGQERLNHNLSIENLIMEILSGVFYNETRKKWENRATTCTLFELDGIQIVRPIGDLVCTSCTVDEDSQTGDSLRMNLTFEHVTFVQLEKTDAPKAAPNSDTEIGTSSKKIKGSQTTNPNDATDTPKQFEQGTIYVEDIGL